MSFRGAAEESPSGARSFASLRMTSTLYVGVVITQYTFGQEDGGVTHFALKHPAQQ